MKKQNLLTSVLIILVAIAIAVYLGHRTVTAPVMPPASAVSTTIGQGDASTEPSLDSGATDPTADSGDKSFTLACDDQKEMMVTFHLPADQSVDVMLSDGRDLSLDNTSTSSAASYTSSDGSDVLSLSGSTLTLTESGTPTYTNCVLDTSTGALGTTEQ